MSEAILDERADTLHRARADAWEFGPTLSNHLPMVLVALRRLGASPARLASFADTYRAANRLRAFRPPVAPITWANWSAHLGDRSREADFRDFFLGQLAALGVDELERRALPTLLPGIAGSALHALMRLAYGHLTDAPTEIATSLAYWATAYLPLPRGEAVADTADPAAILERLRARPHLTRIEPETDLLWHAMRAVGADPGFTAELDRLDADRDSLPRFAAAALALFAGAMDFCALHALTSMHWLRLLPPDRFDRGAALRHLFRALAAVYPKMGMPVPPSPAELDALRHAPCPDWADIAATAIASDDEHDHSLVFSAREEEAFWGDPLYRRVAARRMGML